MCNSVQPLLRANFLSLHAHRKLTGAVCVCFFSRCFVFSSPLTQTHSPLNGHFVRLRIRNNTFRFLFIYIYRLEVKVKQRKSN